MLKTNNPNIIFIHANGFPPSSYKPHYRDKVLECCTKITPLAQKRLPDGPNHHHMKPRIHRGESGGVLRRNLA